jgi:TPR repeat protein
MFKNLLITAAAAFIALGAAASLSTMRTANDMAARLPDTSGESVALRMADDLSAQLAALRTEQLRQAELLSDQQSAIALLERERAERLAIADMAPDPLKPGLMADNDREPTSSDDQEQDAQGLAMPSPERAAQIAAYHAAWLQAVTLETRSADRIAALEAEVAARDDSIVGLMHRIVSQPAGVAETLIAKRRDEPRENLSVATADVPDDAAEPAIAASTMVAALSTEPAAPAIGTVEEGAEAYHAGDFGRAFEIWRVLANKGDAQARFHLGALYFEGRGVTRNLETAQILLELAAKTGHEGAVALRDRVAAELADTQIAQVPTTR